MAWGRKRLGADRDEFDRALRRSLRAAIEGDGARAQSWLERAVELDSGDLDAYQALARLYRDRGEIGRAIRMHQNLLLRSDLEVPERAVARLELARDFEAGGFRDQALASYEVLLSERPRDAAVLEAFARALHGIGDRERRDTLVLRLRRVDPERARALEHAFAPAGSESGPSAPSSGSGIVSRFVARLGAFRKEATREDGLRAHLARHPLDVPARIELAHLLERRGGAAQAHEELERGLELVPHDLDLHRAIGRLALALRAGRGVGVGVGEEHGEVVDVALHAYGRLLDALDAREAGHDTRTAGSRPTVAAEDIAPPNAPVAASPGADAEPAPVEASAAESRRGALRVGAPGGQA